MTQQPDDLTQYPPDGGRILFAEWVGKRTFPGPPSGLPRDPCPICGHPTGDCTAETHLTEEDEPHGT